MISSDVKQVERFPRKRGRPHTKEIVLGPKHPRGRPRKVLVANADDPPSKRRRGRPPKVKGSGGVVVEFGKYVMPAVPGRMSRSHRQVGQVLTEPAQELPPTTNCSMTDPSSMAPIQEIIPEEDPERAANTEDDDNETGEALSEEDDEPDDGDEKDDEKEPCNDDGTPSSSDQPLRVRHLPPPWLMQAFQACVKQLEVRDAQGLPSLYANASTFWVNSPSPYFTLRGVTLPPSTLYNPRFFVWDPQALFKDLRCPNCKKVLHRHSVMSHPRRCVDVTSTFWIVGFRYLKMRQMLEGEELRAKLVRRRKEGHMIETQKVMGRVAQRANVEGIFFKENREVWKFWVRKYTKLDRSEQVSVLLAD